MTTAPETLIARRSMPEAQALMTAEPSSRVSGAAEIGWYDQTLDVEIGSFAVVSAAGEFSALIGEVLRVSTETAAVFVYVHRTANGPTDLALQRRAFFELGGRLWRSPLTCQVEIL